MTYMLDVRLDEVPFRVMKGLVLHSDISPAHQVSVECANPASRVCR